MNRVSSAKLREKEEEEANMRRLHDNKLLITGDDVLIEYVSRLMIALKSIRDSAIK